MGVLGDILGGGGGGPDDDSLTSIYPVDSVARLTPIRTVLDMPSALDLFIVFKTGGNRFEIYNPTDGFSGTFSERSSIEVDGTTVTVELLPSGGWWTADFSISYISGRELEL